jgi:phage gp46-like protein
MDLDIKLQKIGTIYDCDFSDDGDFVLEDGFETFINIALLTDERADEHQMLNPYLRRGWIGKAINNADNPDFPYGSKLWLVAGCKTQKQKNSAIDYAKKSLQMLIDEKDVQGLNVTGDITEDGIELLVDFIRGNDKPNSLSYNLWENTF